jgi:hypothetical protein
MLVILILFSSLITGIEIESISYKNIQIDKLYIKYDKKLIFNAGNIAFLNQEGKAPTNMKLKFNVEKLFDKYFIRINELTLKNPHLKVIGDIIVDKENINLDRDSNVYINNLKLQFHKNLKYVHAEKCFINYKNGSFYFTFKKPTYENIALDGSRASILDFESLKLDLRSKDLLKKPLLELLSVYDIELPVKQDYGKNNAYTKLEIPFDVKKDIKAYVNVKVKNSKIQLYGLPLFVNNGNVIYKDQILRVDAKILKNNLGEEKLKYDVNLSTKINFKEENLEGDFKINSAQFYEITTNNVKGKVFANLKNDFFVKTTFDDFFKLNIYGEEFILKDVNTKYDSKLNSFISSAVSEHKIFPLKLKLKNQFSLDNLISKGKAKVYYINDNLDFFINNIEYETDHNEDLVLSLNAKEFKGTFLGFPFSIKDLESNYKNNKVNGNFSLESLNSNIKLLYENLNFHMDMNENLKFRLKGKNTKLSAYKYPFDVKKTFIEYLNGKLRIENKISNENIEFLVKNRFDLENQTALGNVFLSSRKKNKFNFHSENFDYHMDYKDNFSLFAPKYSLEYTKDGNDHFFLVNNIKYFHKYFKEIDPSRQSSLFIKSDDFKSLNIVLNNLNLDINSSKYETLSDGQDDSKYSIEINLNGYDGKIIYDSLVFEYDKISINSKSENLVAKLSKDKTNLFLVENNGKLFIKSNFLENRYVNKIFGKNWFSDGSMEILVNQKSDSLFTGRVDLGKTVLKEASLVNNLLLFINSTPGIINPLLTIPTFLRFAQTEFVMTGYSMDSGYINFMFDNKTDILNIYDLKTSGKLNDFSGKVLLDFKNNYIEGLVDVIFMKDYGKVISNIPLIGYILLGENGNLYTQVDIKGKIDDPQFETNTIEGILKGVGNSFLRVLGQ